jgi:hypothetical protein
LKVDDVDGRVHHLEKTLIQVIEDNKLISSRELSITSTSSV